MFDLVTETIVQIADTAVPVFVLVAETVVSVPEEIALVVETAISVTETVNVKVLEAKEVASTHRTLGR